MKYANVIDLVNVHVTKSLYLPSFTSVLALLVITFCRLFFWSWCNCLTFMWRLLTYRWKFVRLLLDRWRFVRLGYNRWRVLISSHNVFYWIIITPEFPLFSIIFPDPFMVSSVQIVICLYKIWLWADFTQT